MPFVYLVRHDSSFWLYYFTIYVTPGLDWASSDILKEFFRPNERLSILLFYVNLWRGGGGMRGERGLGPSLVLLFLAGGQWSGDLFNHYRCALDDCDEELNLPLYQLSEPLSIGNGHRSLHIQWTTGVIPMDKPSKKWFWTSSCPLHPMLTRYKEQVSLSSACFQRNVFRRAKYTDLMFIFKLWVSLKNYALLEISSFIIIFKEELGQNCFSESCVSRGQTWQLGDVSVFQSS